MNKDFFLKWLKTTFKQFYQDDWADKFTTYTNFLIEQNQKMNLTRLCNEDDLYQDYFQNSIIPFVDFDLNHKKVLDIGSGSGIPGIVLKIIFREMHLYIIEANGKKCQFLHELCKKLQLKDVYIFHQRAEKINDKFREFFDFVTSRAVAPLHILLEISAPYVKVGGWLIEPKSINYQNELILVEDKLNGLGIELDRIEHLKTNIEMYNLIYKKNRSSNKIYPRAWKQIKS